MDAAHLSLAFRLDEVPAVEVAGRHMGGGSCTCESHARGRWELYIWELYTWEVAAAHGGCQGCACGSVRVRRWELYPWQSLELLH
jgi:hypothetical protein